MSELLIIGMIFLIAFILAATFWIGVLKAFFGKKTRVVFTNDYENAIRKIKSVK